MPLGAAAMSTLAPASCFSILLPLSMSSQVHLPTTNSNWTGELQDAFTFSYTKYFQFGLGRGGEVFSNLADEKTVTVYTLDHSPQLRSLWVPTPDYSCHCTVRSLPQHTLVFSTTPHFPSISIQMEENIQDWTAVLKRNGSS